MTISATRAAAPTRSAPQAPPYSDLHRRSRTEPQVRDATSPAAASGGGSSGGTAALADPPPFRSWADRAAVAVGTLPAVLAVVGALSIASCRTFANPAGVTKVFEKDQLRVDRISWDATRRGTFIIRDGDSVRIISEPPPDAALETMAKISAKFDPKTDGGTTDAEVTETIKALSRAVEVSFLREALFRMNEAHANGAIEDEEFASQFGQVVHSAALLIAGGDDNTGKLLDLLARAHEARIAAIAQAQAEARAAYESELVEIASELARSPADLRLLLERSFARNGDFIGLEAEAHEGVQGLSETTIQRLEGLAIEKQRIEELDRTLGRTLQRGSTPGGGARPFGLDFELPLPNPALVPR